MRASSSVRKALCAVTVAAPGVLLLGCSTVKLAYNQVPHLAHWQLNNYIGLTEAQSVRVRDELGDLHQWHRDTMLPVHAELLQKVQQQLPSAFSPEQACRTYDAVRSQVDKVVTQAEPKLAWLAAQLTDAQIRNLQKKQTEGNADWKKEWMDVTPEKLREQRFKQLLSRAETFYGTLDEPQKAALRAFIAQSSFDPQRTYAERLRRQNDLVQVLQKIAQDRANTAQAQTLLRGYLARFNTSPDAAYQQYARALIDEGCDGFAKVHNAMTSAQRLKAVQSVKGYEQDFLVLAAQ